MPPTNPPSSTTHASAERPARVESSSPVQKPRPKRAPAGADSSRAEQRRNAAGFAEIGRATLSLVHEVANPLNGMFLQAQLLRRDAAASGCKARIVDRIVGLLGEIERLNRLLADFRASARASATTSSRPINVSRALEQALRFTVIDPKIVVQRFVPESLPDLGEGADQLQQVLVNLIQNAVEAMPDGGTLSVRARSDACSVHVEIRDTGTGFAHEIGATEPFQTTKADGCGLGLSITRQLVLGLGGTLRFTSAAGLGSTATVTVPVARDGLRRPGL